MSKNYNVISGLFVQNIKTTIVQSRTQAVRSIEFYWIQMYWNLGKGIFNEQQLGKDRADFCTYLIRNLFVQ